MWHAAQLQRLAARCGSRNNQSADCRLSLSNDLCACRKFLKEVGVTSQREIEAAVRNGIDTGKLAGIASIQATMTLEINQLDLKHRVEGQISLG